MSNKILVEVSARHIHISREDLEKLFGRGYKLTKLKSLNQPGEFSCKEIVTLKNKDKKLEGVRIVGPVRKNTQVEVSKTDAYHLNLDVPLRISGDLKGSASVTVIGPKEKIKLDEGVIIAKRHLHANPKEAKQLHLKDGDNVSIKVSGERSVTFNKVKVRVNKDYSLATHIDVDEGNAAGINQKAEGKIV